MSIAAAKRWKALCIAGMVLGGMLIGAGLLWNLLAKPEHVWSSEQAMELEAARHEMHQLTYDSSPATALSGNSMDSREAKMAAARSRFEKIEAELAAARSLQQWTGVWLTRMGLAALALFGVGYLATQGS
jgi:hypothetical protein